MKQLLLSLITLFVLSLSSLALACANPNCPMGGDCPYENCADCPVEDCPMKTSAAQGKKGSSFFDSADTNKDGKLSRDEFRAAKRAGWHQPADCPLNRK